VAATAAWDWERLRERCLREARLLLEDPAAAEDVVQEALLRGWRRQGDGVQAPVAWLLTITRNEAWRWRRGTGTRTWRATTDEDRLLAILDSHGLPLEPPGIERAWVAGALSALSPQDRELLRLRYGADLTQEQIAQRLKLPEGTVKIRLHRLRARLKKELSE